MKACTFVVLLMLLLAVSGVAADDGNATNGTVSNPEGWYLEDHPYFYNMDKIRLANGTWVTNPNYSVPPLTAAEYYGNVTERVPAFIRWYIVGDTNKIRQGFTDFREFVIFNMVSPMDYGLSLRAQSVRRQWHEAITKFWWKMMGQYLVKKQGENFRSIVSYGIRNFVAARAFERKAATYNSTQWAMEMNWTQDKIDYMRQQIKEGLRVKNVMPYVYKPPEDLSEHVQRLMPDVKQAVQYFQPYVNYTRVYYDATEVLSPPTLPAAITYPWPWHQRLDEVRYIVLDMMHEDADARKTPQQEDVAKQIGKEAADEAEAEAKEAMTPQASQASEAAPQTMPPSLEQPYDFFNKVMGMMGGRRLEAGTHNSQSGSSDDGSDNDSGSGGAEDNSTRSDAVMRRVQWLLREFHFTTGIPRMELMRDHYRPVLFPTLDEFNRLATHGDSGEEGVQQPVAATVEVPEAGLPETPQPNATDYTTRGGVYEATKSFYSFPLMQNSFAYKRDFIGPLPSNGPVAYTLREEDFAPCSVEAPCAVHSAVTVYTPSLYEAVREVFSTEASVSAEKQRTTRLFWLVSMFEEAFDAENRVLKSGLVAASTVWYSYYDRSTDMVADAALGLVNGSQAAALGQGQDVKPLSVYESLTVISRTTIPSPLLSGQSYYRLSNAQTHGAMNVTRVLPYHEPFTADDRFYLIEFLRRTMQEMQDAIDAYELKRDADPMHKAMVNTTQEHAYYDGRMFTLLGFGYLLPATNDYGVAYRDHKIPVPFHLLMRLMVRFQESRLFLEEESLQIVACLAMLHFDVRFYRCVKDIGASTSASTNTTATPTPSTDENATSLVPPSNMMQTPTTRS